MPTAMDIDVCTQADLDGRVLGGASVRGSLPLWVGAGNGLNGKGWDFISPGSDGLGVTADSAQAKKVKWGTTAAGTTLDNAVDLTHLARTAKPVGMAWSPTGALAQTMPRTDRLTNPGTNQQAGKLSLFGGASLARGVAHSNICAICATAPNTPTNQWAAIVDQAGNVLAKSTNLTTTAWPIGTVQTFPLSAPYTPVADIAVYLCLMFTGTGQPIILGQSGTAATYGLPVMFSAVAGTGLTTPASLGATVGALTAQASCCAYLWVT